MSDQKKSDNAKNDALDAAQTKPLDANAPDGNNTQGEKSRQIKAIPKESSQSMPKNKPSTPVESKTTTPAKEIVKTNDKPAAEKSGAKPQSTKSNASAAKDTSINTPTKEKTQKSSAPKTGALWFFTILNLLLIGGIAGAGYWYWMQLEAGKGEQVTSISSLDSRLMKSEKDAQSLANDTQTLNNNQQALTSSIADLQSEVKLGKETNDALQKRISELSGRRPSDWLLAEADYLVNMAGRKLYLEDDVKTAKTLLAEADSRLEDLNDPALFPVRTLIAADIAAINQVNNVSEASVSLAVGGLIPQVSKLPLRTLTLPEAPVAAETTPSSDIKEWKQNLERAWNDITDDLVNKTPIDGPIAPYLSESERWLIEQQLKYALSRAQSAALESQTKVFEQNLLEAVSLVGEHYEVDDIGVSQFLGALENLLNTNFEKVYPDNLQAQKALKDVLEQRVEALFNNGGNTL